jgi:hypothetical protein
MPNERPAAPWFSFLSDLDAQLREDVDVHCMGGFVVSQYYGFARETVDLDVLGVVLLQATDRIEAVAGKGSPLHRKYRVYLERVGVTSYPDSYESRLIHIFPFWRRLKVWALEAHDLALTKLERSIDRDLQDVMYLARAGFLQRETLVERYRSEMRPYLSGPTPTWHDTTMEMWVNACWPAE